MTVDIFIAYVREDIREAELLQSHLQGEGLNCYRDVTSIPGSEEWIREITEAILACHAVLVILSKGSADSRWVDREVTIADTNGKAIVPVSLSDPPALSPTTTNILATHQITFVGTSLEECLPQVAAAVWRAVDRSKHHAAYEDEQDVVDRRTYRREIDFAQDRAGLPLGTRSDGATTLEHDAYVMAAKPNHALSSWAKDLPQTAEFVVEASIEKLEGPDGSRVGFSFGSPYPGDYYQVLLSGYGTVLIRRHCDRKWKTLGSHRRLRQARTGNAVNALKVVRRGNSLHALVNGFYALHATDFDVRVGRIALRIGESTRAAFSRLRIDGIDIDSVARKATHHLDRLEIPEARSLLEYVVKYEPSAARRLADTHPDRRASVLVVVGHRIRPQLSDAGPAVELRDAINRRGDPKRLRQAFIVTDAGLLEEPKYMECPLISVGGPDSNKVTASITDELPDDDASTEDVRIQHGVSETRAQAALWGAATKGTAEAVRRFIESGRLDEFTAMIWRPEEPD